jgi:large subunit ribosomal protein L23
VDKAINRERLLQVLLSPRITEKALRVADKYRQIVFKVASSANKQEVKAAVEMLFEVKVSSVQLLNVKGKRKTFGRIQGKRAGWKKAYVCLKEGYDIDFSEG